MVHLRVSARVSKLPVVKESESVEESRVGGGDGMNGRLAFRAKDKQRNNHYHQEFNCPLKAHSDVPEPV